jgi:hypothetical protein
MKSNKQIQSLHVETLGLCSLSEVTDSLSNKPFLNMILIRETKIGD